MSPPTGARPKRCLVQQHTPRRGQGQPRGRRALQGDTLGKWKGSVVLFVREQEADGATQQLGRKEKDPG